MQFRKLGKTGLFVSALGVGGSRLYPGPTGSGATRGEVLRLLAKARDLGCNCFDTAPLYGGGESEALLGEALSSCRGDVVLMTKFGIHTDKAVRHDHALLRESLEGSLRRLRTDYVDVLILHNPPPETLEPDHPVHEILEVLRREGKLRYVGVSLDSAEDLKRAMSSGRFQVAEVLLNVMCQQVLPAFDSAAARGIGLVAKSPLDSGWLSGHYTAGSHFEGGRRRWSEQVRAQRERRYRRLAELYPPKLSPIQAALGFVLAAPGVAAAIPASRSTTQLETNAEALNTPLHPEVFDRLRERWQREFAGEPLAW